MPVESELHEREMIYVEIIVQLNCESREKQKEIITSKKRKITNSSTLCDKLLFDREIWMCRR